jgi:hypothetical protein
VNYYKSPYRQFSGPCISATADGVRAGALAIQP